MVIYTYVHLQSTIVVPSWFRFASCIFSFQWTNILCSSLQVKLDPCQDKMTYMSFLKGNKIVLSDFFLLLCKDGRICECRLNLVHPRIKWNKKSHHLPFSGGIFNTQYLPFYLKVMQSCEIELPIIDKQLFQLLPNSTYIIIKTLPVLKPDFLGQAYLEWSMNDWKR